MSVKVLNCDKVVVIHRVSGDPMSSITTLIGDMYMRSLEFQCCFPSTIGSLLSVGYLTLKISELSFWLTQVFGRQVLGSYLHREENAGTKRRGGRDQVSQPVQ